MRKELCPICEYNGYMLAIIDSYNNKMYVRFPAQTQLEAAKGEITIGGRGFSCQARACIKCHYVAFYYDPFSNRGDEQIKEESSLLRKIFNFVLQRNKK